MLGEQRKTEREETLTPYTGIAAEGQRATLTAKDVTMRDFDAVSGKYVSRIEWREVAQFDGGEVIFKDGVAGDEMCPHFRQVSESGCTFLACMRICAVFFCMHANMCCKKMYANMCCNTRVLAGEQVPGLRRWCPTHIVRGLLGPEALAYGSTVCNTSVSHSALKRWRASASALSPQASSSRLTLLHKQACLCMAHALHARKHLDGACVTA